MASSVKFTSKLQDLYNNKNIKNDSALFDEMKKEGLIGIHNEKQSEIRIANFLLLQ